MEPIESSAGREPSYDCIVISDLHLGSDVCQAKLLEEFLIWAVEHCRELVINGDIFDDLNFKRLTKRHFACLKIIRRNSDRDDFRLVWVRGNHDGPIDIISHIVGVEILDEYVYDNGIDPAPDPARRPVRHIHDGLSVADRDRLRDLLLHPEVHAAPRRAVDPADLEAVAAEQPVDRAPGGRVRPAATVFATSPAATRICRWWPQHDGILYVNSGTWTEFPPCPFVTVQGADVAAGALALGRAGGGTRLGRAGDPDRAVAAATRVGRDLLTLVGSHSTASKPSVSRSGPMPWTALTC